MSEDIKNTKISTEELENVTGGISSATDSTDNNTENSQQYQSDVELYGLEPGYIKGVEGGNQVFLMPNYSKHS